MPDSLFIEMTDGLMTSLVKTLGDGSIPKRERARNLKKVVAVLSHLNQIPLEAVIVGLGYGCDTLGQTGIFVVFEKTAVTGLTPDLREAATVHGITQKLSDLLLPDQPLHTFNPENGTAWCSDCGEGATHPNHIPRS